jgi:23S rRNA (cytosine1962-C5)-methyltransferase
MTRAGEPWTSLGEGWLDARIDAALAWRTAAGCLGPEATFRLVHGAGDALPGLSVDLYGAFGVASALTPGLVPLATALATRLVTRGLAQGVVVKHRRRGAAARQDDVVVEIAGAAPPERLIVREGPWRFEVHLTAGVNVGLFGDMRAERQRLSGLAAARRVLNLFAYTGTLSVAAATGGAVQVTSVDLSEGVLAWARDNAALNDVAAERHRTVAADARRFVASAAAVGDLYDLVLIDPPSFSTARDAEFAIDRDYAGLITEACRLVVPAGLLWLASNTRGFSLVGAAQAGTAAAGRRAQVVGVGLLPPDHPTELADADARYLQTCLLRLT